MPPPENITEETARSFRQRPELFIVAVVVFVTIGFSGWIVLQNNDAHHNETSEKLDAIDNNTLHIQDQLDRVIDHVERE